MNRINLKIQELEKSGKKAFIPYITAGFPDIKTCRKIIQALIDSGADFIELGMPFSDPIADGPTIQLSSQTAIAKGMNLPKYLALIRKIRKTTQLPLIMMTYYNPLFKFGIKNFARTACLCGLDGVIVPDLLPEEAKELAQNLKKYGIHLIYLVAPTTTKKRMHMIAKISTGFIYYVSLTGVTGIRKTLHPQLHKNVRVLKRYCRVPVYVGFGISSAGQIKKINLVADGVIVGSALIKFILANSNRSHFTKRLKRFISGLSKSCAK
ncbi:MAG: tryptophan synthase subunit alpha [Candidatus Omnitrophica bacterium]|nr:tryptophan synthase subunit alpha [Candidatus Omnitrophota bacterium]MBU1925117.1 tryptophan synthase subunit alpha [Candidatus Omnitrophota bacterium]